MEVSFVSADPTGVSICLRTENENTAGTHLVLIEQLRSLKGRGAMLMNLRLHVGHQPHCWEVSSYGAHYQYHCAQSNVTSRIKLKIVLGRPSHLPRRMPHGRRAPRLVASSECPPPAPPPDPGLLIGFVGTTQTAMFCVGACLLVLDVSRRAHSPPPAASTAWLLYDLVITFEDEVRRALCSWKRRAAQLCCGTCQVELIWRYVSGAGAQQPSHADRSLGVCADRRTGHPSLCTSFHDM